MPFRRPNNTTSVISPFTHQHPVSSIEIIINLYVSMKVLGNASNARASNHVYKILMHSLVFSEKIQAFYRGFQLDSKVWCWYGNATGKWLTVISYCVLGSTQNPRSMKLMFPESVRSAFARKDMKGRRGLSHLMQRESGKTGTYMNRALSEFLFIV